MKDELLSIVFYNVENFYSKETDPEDTFLPNSFNKWLENRYQNKLDKISFAISQIKTKSDQNLPVFVGLAEVENENVLNDLVNHDNLISGNYSSILFESLDERKINVGCLYRNDYLQILESKPIRVVFNDQEGCKSYTRDILSIKANLKGETVYFFIVHLPSKIDTEVNKIKREILLKKLRTYINEIYADNKEANIVIMGDFNDTPTSENIRYNLHTVANIEEINNTELFNPMVKLMSYKRGSLIFKKQWMLFDQMLFSKSFLTEKSKLKQIKTDIFDEPFLTTNINKLGALPFRTFLGTKYIGGYSDHFPIYSVLKFKS